MKATDAHGQPLELTKIAGNCDKNDCESVSLSDRGTAVVQGFVLRGENTPDGEALVEVSVEMLREAARVLD